MVIAATKGGAPTNPGWYHNLKAHPRILAEVGTETFPVEATEVTGEERDDCGAGSWRCGQGSPSTRPRPTRVFPMFRLTRL